jgi:hypothetical protein
LLIGYCVVHYWCIFRVLFAHDLGSRCARLCSYKDEIWAVIQS